MNISTATPGTASPPLPGASSPTPIPPPSSPTFSTSTHCFAASTPPPGASTPSDPSPFDLPPSLSSSAASSAARLSSATASKHRSLTPAPDPWRSSPSTLAFEALSRSRSDHRIGLTRKILRVGLYCGRTLAFVANHLRRWRPLLRRLSNAALSGFSRIASRGGSLLRGSVSTLRRNPRLQLQVLRRHDERCWTAWSKVGCTRRLG